MALFENNVQIKTLEHERNEMVGPLHVYFCRFWWIRLDSDPYFLLPVLSVLPNKIIPTKIPDEVILIHKIQRVEL